MMLRVRLTGELGAQSQGESTQGALFKWVENKLAVNADCENVENKLVIQHWFQP